MPPRRRLAALASAAVLMISATSAAARAAEPDDRFLAGYVAALLELRFGLTGVDPEVRGGVLRLDPAALGGPDPQEVLDALAGIEGLRRVELSEDGAPPPAELAPTAAAEPPPLPLTEKDERLVTGVLPSDRVFEALTADPREPQFATALQLHQGDKEVDTAFSANLGATLPLYGWEGLGAVWQVGVQGGVFSIFDLGSESFDLINSDYLFAAPLTVGFGPFTARARVGHQSSHLGDEFLLREETDRVNLSYEFVDLLLSYDVLDVARVYGGGGALVRTDPNDLDRPFAQAGLELTLPYSLAGERLFPVAAVDVKASQQGGWDPDVSVRAGLEVRSELLAGRRLQILGSYYDGQSPNGQFFNRSIEYYGLGLYFSF